MALPQATILGEPTRGIHSDIYSKGLSNGWQVGLSNQKYILPNGKVYEKEGLPPHKAAPFKGDVVEQGKDDVLEQAIAY
jgi:carboxyl-terminal processing protease